MVAVLHYASEISEVLAFFVILPGACAAAREWSRAARRGEHGNGITALGLGRVRQRRSHRLLRARKLSDQLGVPLAGACKRFTTFGP